VETRKKLLPLPGIEPRFPDRPGSQVTVPTELSWLQDKMKETDFEVRHPCCVIQNIINGVENRRNTTKTLVVFRRFSTPFMTETDILLQILPRKSIKRT
jgi:hypothetical protein